MWHELFFNVSPQKLHEAITDPKNLAQWWTTDVRGSSRPGTFSPLSVTAVTVPSSRPS
jgi:uncharacterized protein YndB with AHSA1/START domain